MDTSSQSQKCGAPESAAPEAEPSGQDSLLLKWGTIKGWSLKSDAAMVALRRYGEGGGLDSVSAMQARDTADQKQLLCDLIDAVDGTIKNDWSGEVMTKDQAKAYVREYGQG